MRRRRIKPPKLTPKRQEKRERRAEWAVAVKARDQMCQAGSQVARTMYCRGYATDAHHVLPRSAGGPDEMWNGIGLCTPCHMWVHDHRIEAQEIGLLAHWGDSSPLVLE